MLRVMEEFPRFKCRMYRDKASKCSVKIKICLYEEVMKLNSLPIAFTKASSVVRSL